MVGDRQIGPTRLVVVATQYRRPALDNTQKIDTQDPGPASHAHDARHIGRGPDHVSIQKLRLDGLALGAQIAAKTRPTMDPVHKTILCNEMSSTLKRHDEARIAKMFHGAARCVRRHASAPGERGQAWQAAPRYQLAR